MSYQKSSPIGHTVLVDPGHINPKAVFEAAPDHQAEGLARLDTELDLSRPWSVPRVPGWIKRRWRGWATLAVDPAAGLLSAGR